MKLKFYLAIFWLSFPLISSAQSVDDFNSDPSKELPKPVSGIHVVPDSDLTMTESMRKEATFKLKQQNKNGYVESDSPYPRQLLTTKYRAASEIKENKGNKDPYDTHLKENISEIKLAFSYNGIPFVKPSNVIAFAAIGGYKDGWTGVKEFFTDPNLGTCTLSLYNIALGHGGARLGKSTVKYVVNNKPTTISVEGSINSGFMYRVSWFDNTFIHDLECANMNFDKKITITMIDHAKLIDKSIAQPK